jgi:hypothetical protein
VSWLYVFTRGGNVRVVFNDHNCSSYGCWTDIRNYPPTQMRQLLLGFIITVLKKKKTWFWYTIVPSHSWHMFVNILLLPNEHELALKTFYKLLILIHASQRLVPQFDSCANFTKRMSIQIARIWTWNPPVWHFKLEDLLILVPTLNKFTKLGHLTYAVT